MTTSLIDLLTRLHEVAPEMCRKRDTLHFPVYAIGPYEFWKDKTEGLMASLGQTGEFITDRPALAWLADAIMAECEARGWSYSARKYAYGTYTGQVNGVDSTNVCTSIVEALLSAFLVAIGRAKNE